MGLPFFRHIARHEEHRRSCCGAPFYYIRAMNVTVENRARSVLRLIAQGLGVTVPILGGVLVGRLASPYLPEFSAWVHTLGVWAPLAFVATYIVVVVVMLPAFLLTMAGGAVFGVVKGSALVLLGATIGGSIAFVLGRTVLREHVARRVAKHPTLATIDRVIGQDGLRLMFLLRLSSSIPFVLSNYALGVTRVRLRDFVVAMIGMVPTTVSYTAFGQAGATSGAEATLPAPVLIGGIAATAALAILLTRIAQKAIREAEGRAAR